MDIANNIYANQYHDTTKRFQGFWRLMIVWKGSVAKLIWHDLIMFLFLYYALSFLYRFWFIQNEVYREYFEIICIYCSRFQCLIPVEFLTGFYVTQVVTRYWDQFMSLQWPDGLALKLVSFVPGQSNYHRTLRRTVMRYVNLSTVLVYRLVSVKVHARFPTYQSMIDAKLLLPQEAARLKAINQKTPHESTWIPFVWAMTLLRNARDEGKIIVEAPVYANLIAAFDYLQLCNKKIFNYGWVNFPLGYTQVATFAVYSYFFVGLFAGQFLITRPLDQDNTPFPDINISYSSQDPYKKHTPDMYFPIFTILEFICYMGWIKVAETLLNPWGDDDEDFQINYTIDRNFQVSYFIVDSEDLGHDVPVSISDPFLSKDIPVPPELPYRDKCGRKIVSSKNTSVPKRAKRLQFATNTWNYFKYRRQHRNQTTMSRLRSLNANRDDKLVYPSGMTPTHSKSCFTYFDDVYENPKTPNSLISSAKTNPAAVALKSNYDDKGEKDPPKNPNHLQVPPPILDKQSLELNRYQTSSMKLCDSLQSGLPKTNPEEKSRRHSSNVNPAIRLDIANPTMTIVEETETKLRRHNSTGQMLHTISNSISYV